MRFLRLICLHLQVSQAKNASNKISEDHLAFKCPLCPLTLSLGQKSAHLTKHFYAELSAEIAPFVGISGAGADIFQCHLCRHIASDRQALLRHVGVQHHLVDKYLANHLKHLGQVEDDNSASSVKSEPEPEVPVSMSSTTNADPQSLLTSDLQCRLCEKPMPFR